MSSEDFISYAAAIACVVAAWIFFPSWSSLLFVLAAVIFLPLRPLRRQFRRWHLGGWRVLALAAAIFLLAVLVQPHTPGGGKARSSICF